MGIICVCVSTCSHHNHRIRMKDIIWVAQYFEVVALVLVFVLVFEVTLEMEVTICALLIFARLLHQLHQEIVTRIENFASAQKLSHTQAMETRGKRARTTELAKQLLEGDLQSQIVNMAGNSLVGVSKSLSAPDECTTINKEFFTEKKNYKEGCLEPHPSHFSNTHEVHQDEEHLKLLQKCFHKVRNDPRCTGKGLYAGTIRKTYWPTKTSINESDIVDTIFVLLPSRETYEEVQLQGKSDAISIEISFSQWHMGNWVDLRIKFSMSDFDNIVLKLIDDTHEDILFEDDFDFEHIRPFLTRVCTLPYLNFEYPNLDDRFVTIRLKGGQTGQRIVMRNYENYHSVKLLDVKRD